MQLLVLIICSNTVTGHLIVVPMVLKYAGRDAWMSISLFAISGVLFALIISILERKAPGKTIVEISCYSLGIYIGRLIGLLYIGFFCLVSSVCLGSLIDFISGSFMYDTPTVVIGVSFLLICTYAVYLGLENFLRAMEVLFPFLIISGILLSVLSFPIKDYDNLLPIVENGIVPVLSGGIPLINLVSEIVVIGMILPFINESSLLKKTTILSIFIVSVMLIGPLTGPVAIFDVDTAISMPYPTYEEIKQIHLGFLENLAPLAILLWLGGSFIKISLFYYASSLGAAQVLGIGDYKKAILPIGIIILLLSIFVFQDITGIRDFLSGGYTFFCIGLVFVLPLILMIAIHFKKYVVARKNIT